MHDRAKSVYVPLERLKFSPDPLGLNEPQPECQCLGCQTKRMIAAQLGFSPDAINIVGMQPIVGGFPLLDAAAPGGEPAGTGSGAVVGGQQTEIATGSPQDAALPFDSRPQVTAFDTRRDGTPRVPADRDRLPSAPAIEFVPRWVMTAAMFVAAGVAWLQGRFRRLVLGQPRLRVVSEEPHE